MRIVDLIEKKKHGIKLSKEEIDFFVNGYVSGAIHDYQVSSLLMAIYFKGMDDEELYNLTCAMVNSGETIDLSNIKGVKCDKHSTGGVGDKTSLVVLPIVASLGVKMAKLSGRGLGHTGGTLDKLESIPGYKIEQTSEHFFEQVNTIGLSIISQSKNITPADKLMYALRDVTATVDSIPLIASSIMSKKIAGGAEHIVIDVKVGNGAFMKDVESAEELSKRMVNIGKLAGKDVVATLTDMSQPLGFAVGNSLEVIEAIDTLKGVGPKDFEELCIELSSEVLVVTKIAETMEEARVLVKESITSKKALNKLAEMIKWQGGNENVINDYTLFDQANEIIDLSYDTDIDVFVESIDALKIGVAAMLLGAGRQSKEEDIDFSVGIVLHKKVGDKISKDEVLATVYTNGKNTEEAINMVLDAYTMTDKEVKRPNIIIKTIK